jgi:hypothetical protein
MAAGFCGKVDVILADAVNVIVARSLPTGYEKDPFSQQQADWHRYRCVRHSSTAIHRSPRKPGLLPVDRRELQLRRQSPGCGRGQTQRLAGRVK